MDKQDKVLVSMTADADLEAMVTEINEGFSGRVTKSQTLSWILPIFRKRYLRECMEEIRRVHFDELAHLEAVVREMKQARKSGNTELNLQEMLAPVLAQNEGQARRKKPVLKGTTEPATESNT